MVALPPLSSCAAIAALAESPALLRLRLLEARIAARRPSGAEARQLARALIDELRRAVATTPSLSYGETAVRLETRDPSDTDPSNTGHDAAMARHKLMLASAFRDLAHFGRHV